MGVNKKRCYFISGVLATKSQEVLPKNSFIHKGKCLCVADIRLRFLGMY
jgi:hypothetical protein